MTPDGTQIDVVTVPDFSGPGRLVFEARTLFFLASWLETFGAQRPGWLRPHVCCVGEPPENVRRLAARADAVVTVHEPLLPAYGGFANKLRGLEAPVHGDRMLLLDTDVFVSGKLEGLTAIDADLSAAPAGQPQVSEEHWPLVYEALDLPAPTERIASIYGEYNLPWESAAPRRPWQAEQAKAMLPYYSSGVLLVRQKAELREKWEEYLRRIPDIFREKKIKPTREVNNGDQVALAVALHALKEKGAKFQQLPVVFNARPIHFRAGALRVGYMQLLHATSFARSLRERGELQSAMHTFEKRWAEDIARGLSADAEARDHDLAQAHTFLWNLWERWVQEAWEHGVQGAHIPTTKSPAIRAF